MHYFIICNPHGHFLKSKIVYELFPPDNGLDVTVDKRWFVYVLRPPMPADPDSTKEEDWTPKLMLCPADHDPIYYHSYLVSQHLGEHHILYSSKAPAGLTPSRVVVAGEKKSESTNYYVETKPSGVNTYNDQVEKYRHGLC